MRNVPTRLGPTSAMTLLALLLIASPSAAGNSFVETFQTTDFRDPVTTVDWNTAGESLRLFFLTPERRDLIDPPGSFEDIHIVGNVAYVTGLGTGLTVLDTSNPDALSVITTYFTSGVNPIGIHGEDEILALASRQGGVQLLDVSDPANPTLLSSFDVGLDNLDVHVAGDILYSAAGVNGLRIHDISDPTAPVFLASLPFGRLRTLDLDGDLLVLADEGASTMPVIDVSDPSAPVLLSMFSVFQNLFDVDLHGSYAYVAAYQNGVIVVDLSDPSNPTQVGGFAPAADDVLAVDAQGDRLYAAGFLGIVYVLDITNRAQPVSATPLGAVNPPSVFRLNVVGGVGIGTNRTGGISAYRVNFPNTPFPVASRNPANFAIDVTTWGERTYLGTSGSLEILDTSDVTNPILLGTHPSFAGAIEVDGTTLYSADLLGAFEILDVQDPANPVLVSSFVKPGGGSALALDVDSDLAVVSYDLQGLTLLDISDPTLPTELSTFASVDGFESVRIYGDRVYAANRTTGDVLILDISNPAVPLQTGSIPAGGATQLQIMGNLLYVGGTSHELRIYDLTPPVPVLLSTFDHPASTGTNGVEVVGSRVFIGDKNGKLLTVDASDPTNPVLEDEVALAGTVSGGTPGRGLSVSGRHVFTALGGAGMQVLQANQDEHDTGRGLAQSITVDTTDATIYRARMVASKTPGVSIEITADGGANWQSVDNNLDYILVDSPGSDLRWRSTHAYDGFGSVMSQISLAWLTEPASIASVEDVPNDQGGQVRVRINRSAFDFTDGLGTPVTGYQVYQLVENAAASTRAAATEPLAIETERALASLGDAVEYRGGRAFVDGDRVANGTFPAGTWEAVGWVAATQRDVYTARVSTVADSSDAGIALSTYLVTTHTTTPSEWYVSAPESGYSTDDLAPAPPQNLSAAYAADGVDLDWSDASEADFRTHRVYRGTDPAFEPSPATLLQETTASVFRDETAAPWNAVYKVTTVDHAGNESEAASPNTATAVEGPVAVNRVQLGDATPNPFNPRTQIRFALPREGRARLAVYDVSGRHVTTLVDRSLGAGTHEIVWDGTSADGRPVASGVYLYRLVTDDGAQSKRMALVR